MAAPKKHRYEVLAPFGCGGGPANDPKKCWWGDKGEIVKLTEKEANPFLAQGLIVESK